MTRNIIINIFLLFIASVTVFGQSTAEKDRQRILTSKIESITLMGHKYDIEGVEDPKAKKKTHEIYDEKGRLKMAITYNRIGIENKTFNKYDSKNRLSAAIIKDGEEKVIDQFKLKYNKDDKIAEKKGSRDGNDYVVSYEYNNEGKLISKIKTNGVGGVIWRDDYEYDDRGNQIREKHSGNQAYETKFTYDANNRMTSSQAFQDTIPGYKYLYTYNDSGKKIKEEQFDGRGNNLNTYTYSYNAAGDVSSINLYSDYLGYLSQKWTYKYDGKGNVLEIKIFDTEEGLPVFTSKYIYRFRK